jgi:gamma-D-glutamyl-L-lysine dipeptidyl-peptidase
MARSRPPRASAPARTPDEPHAAGQQQLRARRTAQAPNRTVTVPDLDDVAAHIERFRREHVPDVRSGVFDVHPELRQRRVVLTGYSTSSEAVAGLLEHLHAAGLRVADEVLRLPDPSFGATRCALIRAAVAPIYAEPKLPAPQISQLVLGMRVELLSRMEDWVRVRAEDGYIGWVHAGYVEPGSDEWAFGWERGTRGEPVVSLGAELVDEDGRTLSRLPWGARVLRHSGAYETPDGRRGTIANGEVVDVDRLSDWFPHRGDSIARTARRWLGAPYLWGGVTLNGVDCSGFTQAVMWMHGIALPRDSDLQAAAVVGDELAPLLEELRAGDLLYFAEENTRISHVAIALGGTHMIHSALGNGGVALNDLAGDLPLERRLREMLVRARRVLSD